MAAQVLFRAMKGMVGVRRVLSLVTLCALAVLMVAPVGSAQGLYDKDLPPPPDSDPGLPPGVGEPPKGGPPKGGLPGMILSTGVFGFALYRLVARM
jgi:hypothetical protein